MLILLAFIGGYIYWAWSKWHIWRTGADQRWSRRLHAASGGVFTLGAAVLLLTLLTYEVVADAARASPALRTLLLIFIPAALMLLAAGVVTRLWEEEQSRQQRQQLGQPVPPRMVPPLVILGLWVLDAVFVALGAGVVLGASVWPAGGITNSVEFDQTLQTAMTGVVAVFGVMVLLGAGHAWWQHQRREGARHAAAAATDELTSLRK